MSFRLQRKSILIFSLLGTVLSVACIAFFLIWQIQTSEYKYNHQFQKINKPKLSSLPKDQNSIRLIIDYGHKFDTIRISQSVNKSAFRGIGFFRNDFENKFDLVYDSSVQFEMSKWNELKDLILKSKIMQMPTEAKQRPVLDGEILTLEIQFESSYKKIIRWSPECFPELAEFEKICNAIAKATNYEFYAFSQPNHPFNPDATSSSLFHHRSAPLR